MEKKLSLHAVLPQNVSDLRDRLFKYVKTGDWLSRKILE